MKLTEDLHGFPLTKPVVALPKTLEVEADASRAELERRIVRTKGFKIEDLIFLKVRV